MRWADGYIAVDWGTTNRRAYRVDGNGLVAEEFEDELGVLSVSPGGFPGAIAEIRRRLGDRPMLLAGMVGSNRGWIEAPYVPCPAGVADVAGAMLWREGDVAIIPGVSLLTLHVTDVMRGEEVQALGAWGEGLERRDMLVCHPGTHAKWILVREGLILSFRTMMTGELFSLLKEHSILADQLQAPVAPDEAFLDGVEEAFGGESLLSGLFGVRARYLLAGDQSGASRASGLLIGSDVSAGLKLAPDLPVAVVGRPELCVLYAAALEQAGRSSTSIDGAVAFIAGTNMIVEKL
jgi:2-dehydro-3-deoxygalactonokinase